MMDSDAKMRAHQSVIEGGGDRVWAAEEVCSIAESLFNINKETPSVVKYWASKVNWMEVVEKLQDNLTMGVV